MSLLKDLKDGKITSRAATEACVAHVDALDSSLHSFLHLDRSAPERASSVDNSSKPLAGLPVAVKDVLMVEGMPATCGSKILEGFMPPFTATAVQKLIDAGAVVIGKTNTDEFAMGSSTENSAYGMTHNPWNLDRVPGGSSGGSAAAVAAGLVPAALGTDTGGSIRQPASFCGVSGIKPTYGRVSRYGLAAYGSSLDSVGVLGRSVDDLVPLFEVMVGKDPLDATTVEHPAPERSGAQSKGLDDLNGIKIGVPAEYFVKGMQAEVEGRVREAIGILEKLGAEIIPINLPHTEYALPVYYIIAPAEASANLARYDGIRYTPRESEASLQDVYRQTRGKRFGAEVERRIMLGTYALSAGYYDAYYGKAQKVRTLIRRDFEDAFTQVDAIAAPIAPTTAFEIGSHGDDPLSMYLEDIFTLPANLAGVPGLALPVGFDGDQMPIGMQLVAPLWREDLLFRVSSQLEQAHPWADRRAPVFSQD